MKNRLELGDGDFIFSQPIQRVDLFVNNIYLFSLKCALLLTFSVLTASPMHYFMIRCNFEMLSQFLSNLMFGSKFQTFEFELKY